jgi:hypothetical protein
MVAQDEGSVRLEMSGSTANESLSANKKGAEGVRAF